MLKSHLADQQVDFQLVPPTCHPRNAAERAIRTFQNHFIAGLCSTDPNFPMHLWDRLLPQALLTLNLMRGSRLNPKLSAYAQLHGPYDSNRTPIAPPGTKVIVHVKPDDRETWAPHGVDGWYVGPALDSYRCYICWIIDTRRECISDTLEWFPTKVTMPLASSLDLVIAAAHDLVAALKKPTFGSPLSPLTDSEVHVLRELSTILTNRVPIVAPPDPLPAPTVPTETPEPKVTWDEPLLRVDPGVTPLRVPPGFEPTVNTPGDDDTQLTYRSANGPAGRKRRKTKRVQDRQKKEAAKKAQDAAKRKKQMTAHSDTPPTETTKKKRKRPKRKKKQPAARTLPAAAPAQTAPSTTSHRYPTRARANLATTSTELLQEENLLKNLSAQSPTLSPSSESAFTATHPDTGAAAEYNDLLNSSKAAAWEAATADELGRLASGNLPHMTEGTETIHFIYVHQLPKGKKATYVKMVVVDKPNREIKERVRMTAGGDQVAYIGDCSTKTANLTTAKCLFNSVVSTPQAKFMTMDIKDFYLNTPMELYEYLRIPVKYIPETIMKQYKLHEKVHKGYVYVEVRKGMYGLPHAGKIANDRLVDHLKAAGFIQAKHTHGLFSHETRKGLLFSLVVDDFGVQYIDRADDDHLADTLKRMYTITMDWTGTKYLGLTLRWDYKNRTCDMSMPKYIEKALLRFAIPTPKRAQHSPHAWAKPDYGAKTQLTAPIDDSSPLSQPERTRIQEITGTLLYYG